MDKVEFYNLMKSANFFSTVIAFDTLVETFPDVGESRILKYLKELEAVGKIRRAMPKGADNDTYYAIELL